MRIKTTGHHDQLVRLYELCGFEIDKDAGTVRMDSSVVIDPVEVIFRAVPGALSIDEDGMTVTLRLLVDPTIKVVRAGDEEHFVKEIPWDAEVTLPVEALRFLADEKTSPE